VTGENRAALWKHCAELTEIVLAGRGKFYFAKDLVIGRQDMLRMFPPEKLDAFLRLKRELDPEEILQTDLHRRVFAGAG
jgi:FAD/FMN-containing dehydrogenase